MLLHRLRELRSPKYVQHMEFRPATPRIESNPSGREDGANDRHVAPGPRLESLATQAEAPKRRDATSQAVVQRPADLAFVQQRRAVTKSSLEGRTRDARPRHDVVRVERHRAVKGDTTHLDTVLPPESDLISCFGSRFEHPEPGRRGMRRHGTFCRQNRREETALPRIDRADDPEHPRSDPSQYPTRDESVSLVVGQIATAELIERHQTMLGGEERFERCERCLHPSERRCDVRQLPHASPGCETYPPRGRLSLTTVARVSGRQLVLGLGAWA